jgi:putative two-component system response regulator
MAREIAVSHHERWDGGGYPRGIAGESIPLSARITAIADVFDALTSARPYKPARTSECALESIRLESGKHFDPAVCAAFLASRERIEEIRVRLSDEQSAVNQCDGGSDPRREFSDVPLVSDSLLTAVPIEAS